MERMFYNITWSDIDSKIIQDIEHAKETPGFDINLEHDEDNWSLLMNAVHLNRKDLVRYLLSVPGIHVNHRSKFDSTVLHLCDQVSILKLLLDRKDLDVNIQTKGGRTGLHCICRYNCIKYVKELLLDARCDALIRDEDGDTAQDIALKNEYYRIAKIIRNSGRTSLLRIPNNLLLYDIVRMIIEEYT